MAPALEGVQVAEFGEPVLFLGDFEHLRQAVRRRGRVVDGAVGVFEAHAQRLADALEFERLQFRQQLARQGQGIQNRRVELAPQPAQLRFEQLAVKRGVVGGNRSIADEVHQLRDSGLRRLLIRQHHVRNACDFGNFRPQGDFRVHQNRQRIHQRARRSFSPRRFQSRGLSACPARWIQSPARRWYHQSSGRLHRVTTCVSSIR